MIAEEVYKEIADIWIELLTIIDDRGNPDETVLMSVDELDDYAGRLQGVLWSLRGNADD